MDHSRRRTLQSLAGLAGGLGLAGCTEQSSRDEEDDEEDDEDDVDETTSGPDPSAAGDGSLPPPDLGGYLDDANNYAGSVVDETGRPEVSVWVGAGSDGLAFGSPAIHVDNGATVRWEWTGDGGAHNIVAEDGTFESGSPVQSNDAEFEYTFEEDGIYEYYCAPHVATGMKAAVVVGTDYPVQEPTEGDTWTAPDAYLHDANNYDGTVTDGTGREEVAVDVGAGHGLSFEPVAVRVSPGTTVVWNWTGDGGAHSVVAEDGSFESGSPVDTTGVEFEYTFEVTGVYRYYCVPHKASGMKAAVIVDDR